MNDKDKLSVYEEQLQIGKEYYKDGRFDFAREHFEKAYDLLDETEANLLLVKTLNQLNLFEEAEQIIKEKREDYLESDARLPVYLNALLGQKKIQTARLLIFSEISVEKREIFLDKINATETFIEDYDNFRLLELQKRIASWYPTSYEEADFITEMEKLPFPSYLFEVSRVISDEKYELQVRNRFLNDLICLELSQKITLITIENKKIVVSPNELIPINETTFFNEVVLLLEDYTASLELSVKNKLVEEVNYLLRLMFPVYLLEELSAKKWLQVTLKNYSHLLIDDIDWLSVNELSTGREKELYTFTLYYLLRR